MEFRASAQRCPQCNRTTRVLADEVGLHACPHCGYDPFYDEEEEELELEDEEEEGEVNQ